VSPDCHLSRLTSNRGYHSMEKLTKFQQDGLKGIGNIGAGNAATGLSQMLNKTVSLSVSKADISRVERVPEMLGGPEQLVATVCFRVAGALPGNILMVFPLKEALRLVDLLVGRKRGRTKILDEYSGSALKEIGNICTGSYLMALAEVVKTKLTHSIPGLAVDMLQAVMDRMLITLACKVERVVIIETDFSVEKDIVRGHFVFLPEPEGLVYLLNAIGGRN